MKILELIRDRLTERRADARTRYWQHVQRIAGGALSERAAKQAAEEIETLLPALGKSLDDVQRDIDTMAEVQATTGAATKRDADKAELRRVVAAGAEVEKQAQQLEARAKAMRAKQAEEIGKAKATLRATDGAAARLAELRRRLAVAGFPEAVEQTEQAKQQLVIESKASDLRAIEAELREAQAALDTFGGVASGAETALTAGARRAQQEVWRLERLRDQAAAELDALRNGGTLDDQVEDVDAQTEEVAL